MLNEFMDQIRHLHEVGREHVTTPLLHATKSKVEQAKTRLEEMQSTLRVLGERSTFHGIDVLLDAKPGWSRRFAFAIVLAMCIACFITVSRLVGSFVNMPISTVINNGQAEFTFPVVTICPDSPITMAKILEQDRLQRNYRTISNYWIKAESGRTTPDPLLWPPHDNRWRERVKRSFRPLFLANQSALAWRLSDLLVECRYNGQRCHLDENEAMIVSKIPTASASVTDMDVTGVKGSIPVDWDAPGLNVKSTAGVYSGNDQSESEAIGPTSGKDGVAATTGGDGENNNTKDDGQSSLPSSWPNADPEFNRGGDSTSRLEWPKDKVLLVEHPSKYICYQFRVSSPIVRQPGPSRGLHLVFKRPYNRGDTQPALLTVESRPALLQDWDDRRFLKQKSSKLTADARKANALDGFQVIIQPQSQLTLGSAAGLGSLNADDILGTSSSRDSVTLGVRFGQQASIGLGQYIHKRLSSVYRECQQELEPHKFLELSTFTASGGYARRYFQLAYSQQNCITQRRQLVMLRHCMCLSESYLVPLQLANELARYGFCHASSSRLTNNSKAFNARITCHDRVASMTRQKILDLTIPTRWGKPILIQLTNDIQRHWLCPRFCNEAVTNAQVIQHLDIASDLDGSLINSSGKIDRADLAAVSIYATSTRVAIVSEGEQMNIFNLLASLGGTFGLFLGLSGVTLFEIIEALVVICKQVPAMLKVGCYQIKRLRRRMRKQKLKGFVLNKDRVNETTSKSSTVCSSQGSSYDDDATSSTHQNEH